MAKNMYHQEGRTIELPVPAGTVSGDPVAVGKLAGVALQDRDSAGNSTVDTRGAYLLPVKAINNTGNSAIAVGDDLYYVAEDTPKISKKVSGTFMGRALGAVLAGEAATIPVRLGDGPATAEATILADGVTIELDDSIGLTLVDAGVTADKLGGVANDKPVHVPIGAVTATATVIAFIAPGAGTLKSAVFANKSAIAANDTDYWTLALKKGSDTIVTKNTKATGGSALVAYTALTLGTLDATHKVLAAGDVVTFVLTKAASAGNLAEAALTLTWAPEEE